jgi:hypothetical protein
MVRISWRKQSNVKVVTQPRIEMKVPQFSPAGRWHKCWKEVDYQNPFHGASPFFQLGCEERALCEKQWASDIIGAGKKWTPKVLASNVEQWTNIFASSPERK